MKFIIAFSIVFLCSAANANQNTITDDQWLEIGNTLNNTETLQIKSSDGLRLTTLNTSSTNVAFDPNQKHGYIKKFIPLDTNDHYTQTTDRAQAKPSFFKAVTNTIARAGLGSSKRSKAVCSFVLNNKPKSARMRCKGVRGTNSEGQADTYTFSAGFREISNGHLIFERSPNNNSSKIFYRIQAINPDFEINTGEYLVEVEQ